MISNHLLHKLQITKALHLASFLRQNIEKKIS